MRKIDFIYKNFNPLVFSQHIKKYNVDYSIKLTQLILKSVKDIDEIKNEINLHEFTKLGDNLIYKKFVKKYKNYNHKDIEEYFIKKHNILNNSFYDEDLSYLLDEHIWCGEFFRKFKKFFEIIHYFQIDYKDYDRIYMNFYCLFIKTLNKYYLFRYEYQEGVEEQKSLVKTFKRRPTRTELIKFININTHHESFIKKETIRLNEIKIFKYDKSDNQLYSEGYKLKHKIIPHFKSEEEYFNYHNTKGDYSIASSFALSNPEKYFHRYFKNGEGVSSYLTPSSGKIKEKISSNKFFNFVMSNKLNYQSNIKFIEKIIYSYDDLEDFLKYIPKNIQESKSLKEEIRILRLFRVKNKKFIVKVFKTNKDKLPDLIKSYMPSTIFEDPYLMIELIKLDINSIADISKKLKKNKKFMSKVKKLLDEK
tara:strand:- start:46 stop:1308 length:1263 start_codon:yes stop_codon:yes gene_type:complete